MIFTPASTSSSASGWAAPAGTASTPTTMSSSSTTCAQVGDGAHLVRRRPACRPCAGRRRRSRRRGSRGRRRCPSEAIAWPRWPAPNSAMLCWPAVRRILRICDDQRVDVVADAALAELAEAGEVAADLGRVDVRVVGELLRGDRLLAHLPGLGEHLQVAREARGDAEREALGLRRAVDPLRVRAVDLPDAHAPCDSTEPQPARQVGLVDERSSETLLAVELDHRDPLEVAARAARRRTRCRPRAARRTRARARSRSSTTRRLVAEVAARPRT